MKFKVLQGLRDLGIKSLLVAEIKNLAASAQKRPENRTQAEKAYTEKLKKENNSTKALKIEQLMDGQRFGA